MKKCVVCRTVIDKSLPFITCCGGKCEWEWEVRGEGVVVGWR